MVLNSEDLKEPWLSQETPDLSENFSSQTFTRII